MGCSSSKAAAGADVASPAEVGVVVDKTAQSAVDFPLLTPMLVMPFAQFKKQGCIAKSTAGWRKKGLLVEYREGLVVVFVSQRW